MFFIKNKKVAWTVLLIIFLISGILGAGFYYFNSVNMRGQKSIISTNCRNFFSEPAKQISASAYLPVYKSYVAKEFWLNPLERFTFFMRQYDSCRFFQPGIDAGKMFDLDNMETSEGNLRDEFLKLYSVANSINGMFGAMSCDSPEAEKYAADLKGIARELANVDVKNICHFLRYGGSEDEIKNFCAGDNGCYILFKNDENSYLELDEGRRVFFDYIKSLRTGNKNYCPPTSDRAIRAFPHIACEFYFSRNRIGFCDLVYNGIKKDFCD